MRLPRGGNVSAVHALRVARDGDFSPGVEHDDGPVAAGILNGGDAGDRAGLPLPAAATVDCWDEAAEEEAAAEAALASQPRLSTRRAPVLTGWLRALTGPVSVSFQWEAEGPAGAAALFAAAAAGEGGPEEVSFRPSLAGRCARRFPGTLLDLDGPCPQRV